MPFYEYQCPQCGVEKEVLHGINDKPEIPCEQCEGVFLQRLISAAGFRLKGGGWYETDFKKDGKRNIAGEAKAESSGGEGASKSGGEGTSSASSKESKTESKPASKQASGTGSSKAASD